MNKSADNVIRVNFWACDVVRTVRHPRPDVSNLPSGHDVSVISAWSEGLEDSVSSECSRVLELPQSFRYKVHFDRIPAHDRHAKGFFWYMARSGIVTLLIDEEIENPLDSAFLEITEPDGGEVFRISVDEFVAYTHSQWSIADQLEKECFLRDAMNAYGLELYFRDKGELDEISATVVTKSNFDGFRPESMVVVEGTEGGFPTVAYFTGGGLEEDLEMELKPEFFVNPSKITVLHLMMYVLDSFNQEGWEVPSEATLAIMKKPYVREGGVSVPMSLIRPAVLAAISRRFTHYDEMEDEEERLERFFRTFLIAELAESVD